MKAGIRSGTTAGSTGSWSSRPGAGRELAEFEASRSRLEADRAAEASGRADREAERSEREAGRAELLAAQLGALGIEPEA